jgi:MSHA biogenesis protein MshE
MTGYRGRVAVYELLEIDREQADAIRRGDLTGFAKIAASRPDYKPLARSAIELVGRGMTTVAEAMRSVSGIDEAAQAPSLPVDEELAPEHVLSLLA